jgi:class 3 adenylate cyclase
VAAGPVLRAVVAGKPSVFGPTVNCAARVQSSGYPDCAHASASFLEVLMKEAGGISKLSTELSPCGDIWLKGFGTVPTYMLHVGNSYAKACLQRALDRRNSKNPDLSQSALLRMTKWNSISHI